MTKTIKFEPSVDFTIATAMVFADSIIKDTPSARQVTNREFLGEVVRVAAALASNGEYTKLTGILQAIEGTRNFKPLQFDNKVAEAATA